MSLQITVSFNDPERTVFFTHDNNHYKYLCKYTKEFNDMLAQLFSDKRVFVAWYRVGDTEIRLRNNKFFLAQMEVKNAETSKIECLLRCYYKFIG